MIFRKYRTLCALFLNALLKKKKKIKSDLPCSKTDRCYTWSCLSKTPTRILRRAVREIATLRKTFSGTECPGPPGVSNGIDRCAQKKGDLNYGISTLWNTNIGRVLPPPPHPFSLFPPPRGALLGSIVWGRCWCWNFGGKDKEDNVYWLWLFLNLGTIGSVEQCSTSFLSNNDNNMV